MATPSVLPAHARAPFDPLVGQAFCGLVAAGASYRKACRGLGLKPGRVDYWRKVRPEFDQAVKAAEAARGPAAPGCEPMLTEELVERLFEAVAQGAPLHLACTQPGMPSERTVRRWLREEPWVREAYVDAREAQGDRLFYEGLEASRGATPATVGVAKLRVYTARWAAARLAPKVYGERIDHAHDVQGPVKIEIVRFGDLEDRPPAE